ncbi:hypothetical protein [Amycolatopsis sp. cmx-4-68]|uniref:hypothetical protein n=1 Tax=Amycolatopsis sp. cmx-4-68 TaxID=2790938 RepID=UPI003978CA52
MNKKLVGSAVVGAAVVAIVAAQFLSGPDAAPAAAPPSPTAPAPTATTLPYQGAFVAYQFPDAAGGRGWSVQVPVPADWTVTHDKDRATYRSGETTLEVDRVPLTQEDPMGGLSALEKSAHYPGYQLSTIADHAPVGDLDAARWEFSYQGEGGTRQVREIGIGVGDALITIRYDAPQAEFLDHVKVLEEALKVSAPG